MNRSNVVYRSLCNTQRVHHVLSKNAPSRLRHLDLAIQISNLTGNFVKIKKNNYYSLDCICTHRGALGAEGNILRDKKYTLSAYLYILLILNCSGLIFSLIHAIAM